MITINEAAGAELQKARIQILLADVQKTLAKKYNIHRTILSAEVEPAVYPNAARITVIVDHYPYGEFRHQVHPINGDAENVAYFLKCSIAAAKAAALKASA